MGLIYLDTCLLVYAIEGHPEFGARVLEALSAEPPGRYAITPLVKLECLAAPMRTGNLVLQQYYEQALEQLVLLPMTDEVFVQGARLRARFGIKTPDALHLAAAQHHGCSALWTHDERLVAAAHGLAVNVLAAPAGSARPR
ncbi:MAG: type II toxin-antitoxin system VapC family toxin [Xanthomonadales bacterium]|nr:type II toxin-antitoxin system VapC family toxin [Xanthomonadales bacterium]